MKFHKYLLLTMIIMLSCTNEKTSEFEGLVNEDEDPYAFLEYQNTSDNVQEQTGSNSNNASYFGQEYRDIIRWGRVEFAQVQNKITEQNTSDVLEIIARSGTVPDDEAFYPNDVHIGTLTHRTSSGFVEKKTYDTIELFFQNLEAGTLKETLPSILVPSEVPLIRQQLENVFNLGLKIKETRVGKIDFVDNDSFSCLVRVISHNSQGEGRAEMRFYFVRVKGEWLINAIEGDIELLAEQYVFKGQFSPQGTTGITQGF